MTFDHIAVSREHTRLSKFEKQSKEYLVAIELDMFRIFTQAALIHHIIQSLCYLLTVPQSGPSGFPMIDYNLLVPAMRGCTWIGLETAFDKIVHRAKRFDLLQQVL